MDQVDSADEKIVAILHDVVENNPQWSLSRLSSEGFKPKVIIQAVDAMTRRTGESYELKSPTRLPRPGHFLLGVEMEFTHVTGGL
jgi:hypothetical protein